MQAEEQRAGELAQHEHDPADHRVLIFALVGFVAIAAGLVGLATIGYWYGVDMGWSGSGSTIVEPRDAIVAAALAPAAAIAIGVVTVLVRHDVPFPSLRGIVLAAATLLLAGSVVFAVGSYPQVRDARMIGIAADGTVAWVTDVPVTEVFGIRSETERTVTLEGRADRRACDPELRAVTLDRVDGEVLDVEILPTTYDDQSQVPPPPASLEPGPGGFDVEQGSAPFICRS